MINLRLKKLKERIKNGEILVGTAVWLTDAIVSEQLGTLGYDFVWIDGEHSVLSNEQIRAHIMASELTGMATIVRVPDHNPATVKPILEIAPDAVIFPMINTAEEARLAVASCLYPPKGIRGYGPNRAHRFGSIPNDEYLADTEKCFLKIMQIEHVEAVKNLDEKQAAQAASILSPGRIIPCHFWNFAEHGGDPGKFAEYMKQTAPRIPYTLMSIGEMLLI